MKIHRTVSMHRRIARAAIGLLLVSVTACAGEANDPDPRELDPAPADPAAADWRDGWEEAPQWGGRVGYIDARGDLRVRLHYGLGSPFVTVASDVEDFQLLDWRIAVLQRGGTLLVGERELNQPLVVVDRDVAAFQLTLTRLGILRHDGTFRVKESTSFEPRTVATGVAAFQLLDDRAGVLGSDGTLWLAYGVVRDLQPVARDVVAFQLEREWVAYVQADGGGTRLMLGRWSPKAGLEVREQARDLIDFEIEVFVSFADFSSRLHLAAADRRGNLLVGEGAAEPLALAPVAGVRADEVHWSGGRLAVLDPERQLWMGVLDRDAGTLSELEPVGMVERVSFNPEGALLVRRPGEGLELVTPVAPLEPATAAAGEPATVTGTADELVAASLRLDVIVPAASLPAETPPRFQVSSIRPAHTRRPVGGAPVGPGGQTVELVDEPLRLLSRGDEASSVR